MPDRGPRQAIVPDRPATAVADRAGYLRLAPAFQASGANAHSSHNVCSGRRGHILGWKYVLWIAFEFEWPARTACMLPTIFVSADEADLDCCEFLPGR